MKKTILIIGLRRKCYQAALKLGYNVLLWSDGPLKKSRKKDLSGWLETPYADCIEGLNSEAKSFLESHQISSVIANSEETVILGARARQFLGLKPLGYKVVERFHNKFVMKNSAAEAGIPITKYKLIGEDTTAEELVSYLGLPLVVKPVDESGAQDVKVARSVEDTKKIMSPGLLAEAFVEGSEISVETFVQDGEPMFHNCTEYLHQWRKSAVPASLSEDLKEKVLELNDKVIKHFKLDRGVTHSEFYLTKDGPVFGEIAVRPPGGYYMELIQKVYGFDAWENYIKLSCGVQIEALNQKSNGHAAVVMFHPGAGKVSSIEGSDHIKTQLGDVIDLQIRVKPGDTISSHTNTSNEVGHILFWEETREALEKSISVVENGIQFNLEQISESHL